MTFWRGETSPATNGGRRVSRRWFGFKWASAAGDKLSTEQTEKVSDSKRCRTVGKGHGFDHHTPATTGTMDSAAKDWMKIEFLFETPQSSLSSAVDITSACSPSAIAFPPSYDEILYHDTPLAAKAPRWFWIIAPWRRHPVRSYLDVGSLPWLVRSNQQVKVLPTFGGFV